jgi:hypothetical protein
VLATSRWLAYTSKCFCVGVFFRPATTLLRERPSRRRVDRNPELAVEQPEGQHKMTRRRPTLRRMRRREPANYVYPVSRDLSFASKISAIYWSIQLKSRGQRLHPSCMKWPEQSLAPRIYSYAEGRTPRRPEARILYGLKQLAWVRQYGHSVIPARILAASRAWILQVHDSWSECQWGSRVCCPIRSLRVSKLPLSRHVILITLVLVDPKKPRHTLSVGETP